MYGKASLREVLRGQRREHVARPRAPDPEARPGRGDVADLDAAVLGQVLADPLAVVVAERRPGDDREQLLAEPGDGEVALDPAAAVEHLGVGDLARPRARPGCRRGARAARRRPGPRSPSSRTSVSSKIATASRVARCSAPIAGDQCWPAQPRGRSDSSPARGVRLVPVDPLPARLLAEGGAVLGVPGVRGGDPQRPPGGCARGSGSGCRSRSRRSRGCARGCRRASGTGRRSGARPSPRGRGSARPRRSTRRSPCRSRRRRRARGRRSRRRRRSPRDLRLAEAELVVGGERLGPVDQLGDLDLVHHRHPALRVLGDLGEAVPVVLEQAAVEVGRDRVEPAGAVGQEGRLRVGARSRPSPGRRRPRGSRPAGRGRAGSAAAGRRRARGTAA